MSLAVTAPWLITVCGGGHTGRCAAQGSVRPRKGRVTWPVAAECLEFSHVPVCSGGTDSPHPLGGRHSRSHLRVWEPRPARRAGNRREVCSPQVWTHPLPFPLCEPQPPRVLSQPPRCVQNSEGKCLCTRLQCFSSRRHLKPWQALQTSHAWPRLSAFSGRFLLLSCGLSNTHTPGRRSHEVEYIVSHALSQGAGVCPLCSNSKLHKQTSRTFIHWVVPSPHPR